MKKQVAGAVAVSLLLSGCGRLPGGDLFNGESEQKDTAQETQVQTETKTEQTEGVTEEQEVLPPVEPKVSLEISTEQSVPVEMLTEAEIPETTVLTEAGNEPTENGFAVCIDAGHQGSWVDMSAQEPNAPGSSVMKAKCSTGTQGAYTGIPEYQLNLDISLKLEKILLARGYKVTMTRSDNDARISNSERAQLAGSSGSDIMVRIHANGSDDHSVAGALAMTISPENPYQGAQYAESYRLAGNILDRYCEATGFRNIGIQYYDDMTGLNWCEVPSMILEMGFMTNQGDDTAMQDPAMQDKMAESIADGIDDYFGIDPDTRSQQKTQETSETAVSEQTTEQTTTPATVKTEAAEEGGPIPKIRELYTDAREAQGENWAVSYEDLTDGTAYSHNGNAIMQSASVIKVYIMGAVYERICYPDGSHPAIDYTERYEGELKSLLTAMITVSDNDASNQLITILGNGDAAAGRQVVNEFCSEHGFLGTSLGRMFMESNPTGDNYTTSEDCRRILGQIYRGELVNAEASAKMLELLKGQQTTYKIPALLPEGFTSANKTGEMPEGYGLGCIENDVAIIFSPYGDYVLTVLSGNLAGKNSEAISTIASISAAVAGWVIENAQ